MLGDRASLLGHRSSDRTGDGRPRSLVVAAVGLLSLLALAVVSASVLTQYKRDLEVLRDAVGVDTEMVEPATDSSRDLLSECDERFLTQTLDHFDVGAPTYEQRYFVCDRHFRPDDGALFFYAGNEADVELYLNHTGLMWENAREFGAMLVFAEHRYFGQSIPFRDDVRRHMQFLSTEQALADFAVLITHLKEQYKRDIPVIGFGGSYGGMLVAWLRMKYPHVVDGAIAGSAPVLSFLHQDPPVDMGSYARIVTRDASPATGAAPRCVPNVRRSWEAIRTLGETAQGRAKLKHVLKVCEHTRLDSEEDVAALMLWAKEAFDTMAMGNYPYPSSYVMNGRSVLPAYPMRVSCSFVQDAFADDLALMDAFSRSVGVYYNSTRALDCYDFSAPPDEVSKFDDLWEYIICAETYQPQSVDGVHDMFWPIPWNLTADDERCRAKWGVRINTRWGVTQYGGRKALRAASNIVFSNGDLDPWSGTGVLESASDSVLALKVEGGAHHLDLMFATPLDPPGVVAAREVERQHIARWVHAFYEQKRGLRAA